MNTLKKLLLLSTLSLSPLACARELRLKWNPNSPADNINYYVIWGKNPNLYVDGIFNNEYNLTTGENTEARIIVSDTEVTYVAIVACKHVLDTRLFSPMSEVAKHTPNRQIKTINELIPNTVTNNLDYRFGVEYDALTELTVEKSVDLINWIALPNIIVGSDDTKYLTFDITLQPKLFLRCKIASSFAMVSSLPMSGPP